MLPSTKDMTFLGKSAWLSDSVFLEWSLRAITMLKRAQDPNQGRHHTHQVGRIVARSLRCYFPGLFVKVSIWSEQLAWGLLSQVRFRHWHSFWSRKRFHHFCACGFAHQGSRFSNGYCFNYSVLSFGTKTQVVKTQALSECMAGIPENKECVCFRDASYLPSTNHRSCPCTSSGSGSSNFFIMASKKTFTKQVVLVCGGLLVRVS